MKIFFILILILISLVSGFPVTDVPDPDFSDFEIPKTLEDLDPGAIVELFIQFERAYQKEYRSPLEQAKARAFFGENVATIIKLNQKYADQNLEFGINYYTDFPDEEFAEKVANLHVDSVEKSSGNFSKSLKIEKIPENFDWRDRANTVGGVSNQGYCGCSWGYTVASLVQSAFSIRYNRFVSPSEQQLCDCAQGGNSGCGGGSVRKGMEYAKKNGLVLENNYQKNVLMDYCEEKQGSLKLSNYHFVSPQSSNQIQQSLLRNGPIGVGFKVSKSFRHYKSGIFTLNDCEDHDDFIGWHSAIITGYGISFENSGNKFWIAKNSWSPSFGESGFFKIAKGVDLCEIESKMPIFVEV